MRAVRVRSAGAEDRLSPALRSMLWCAVPREACSHRLRSWTVGGVSGCVNSVVERARVRERGLQSG